MPTATDLVTDLPADFEVFGQAVDSDFVDLLGGTTGQILSKASATDLDFTWITNDVGDITAVNVTAPITGGGTSGAVTIGVSAASTSASGVVQLSDSTSTTSSVLASTSTATKSAYDLADAAIAKSTLTTAGDVLYRNATVPVRLGIGTAGQVLKVNSGATAPEWGAAPSGTPNSAYAYVATQETTTSATYVGLTTPLAVTVTTGTKALVIVSAEFRNGSAANAGYSSYAVSGATTIAASDQRCIHTYLGSATNFQSRTSAASLLTGLTAGSNTFTVQYKTDAGTGSWLQRDITVIDMGS